MRECGERVKWSSGEGNGRILEERVCVGVCESILEMVADGGNGGGWLIGCVKVKLVGYW